MSERLSYTSIKQKHSLPDGPDFRADIVKLLTTNPVKIVILDDDPTGIQTVHGCLLLTNWKEETLQIAFEDKTPFFYILSNARSLDANNAEKLTRQIVENVLKVNQEFKKKLIFISRSDSTLRGHFPIEPETIKHVLAENIMESTLPVFFIPCFLEAGRFTIQNVHYIKEGDELIPVHETEFARDTIFGYKNSELTKYIIEKSGNSIKDEQIGSLSIEELRTETPDRIEHKLSILKQKKFAIINATDYYDLYKFSLSFLRLVLSESTPVVLRTSSSLPKAISGIPDKSYLTKTDLVKMKTPGIFIVGSHVQKTTVQLMILLEKNDTEGIEIDVQKAVKSSEKLMPEIIHRISSIWASHKTPVIYTSRKEIRFENKSERLNLGIKISEFLVNIVKSLPAMPAYTVAKGGITSHDILTKALNVDYARVSGQIIAGVPVIITGKEHKYPGLPYIIFPGNVGDVNALAKVFEILS